MGIIDIDVVQEETYLTLRAFEVVVIEVFLCYFVGGPVQCSQI